MRCVACAAEPRLLCNIGTAWCVWADTVDESTLDTLPPTGELSDTTTVSGGYGATLDPRPGMVLASRYALIEPIGRGASGWVWKARHTVIGKSFAIKLLATRTGSFDDEAAVRMLREANALSRIDHPNVTAVTDFGHAEGGTPFIVMELLEGQPLRALLDASRLSWKQARVWAVQILEGVEAAHREGIVHRDLKAANLFVTAKDSRIKVLDFGLARSRRRSDVGPDQSSGRLTAVGEVFGTPATMSPEQIAGEAVDARSDLYSVGCVLYEMIAGRPPAEGTSAEILYQHVYGDPTPLRALADAEVPDAVCDVVHRCLRKDPAERPASVTEVREAFDLRKLRRGRQARAAKVEDSAQGKASSALVWRRVTAAAVAAGGLFALVAASRPSPAAQMHAVEFHVPAVSAAAVGVPALHADPPIFERAQPKHALTPVSAAAAADSEPPPKDTPKDTRRPRKRVPSERVPRPNARPVVDGSPDEGRSPVADARVPELKNPFAK